MPLSIKMTKEDKVIFMSRDEYLSNAEKNSSASKENASTIEEEHSTKDKPVGAIDPETGEINWDCPCLKSAIAPPCGEKFKAAFSCFVKSTTEPKGEDCIEVFREMQDCFREHPDIYMKDEESIDNSNNDKREGLDEKEN